MIKRDLIYPMVIMFLIVGYFLPRGYADGKMRVDHYRYETGNMAWLNVQLKEADRRIAEAGDLMREQFGFVVNLTPKELKHLRMKPVHIYAQTKTQEVKNSVGFESIKR